MYYDKDSDSEDYITRYLEGRLHIHLPEQQVYPYSDSENVSMSVQHNLPRESFPMNDGINVSSEGNSSHILEDSGRLLQYLDSCPRTENVSIAVQHALPSEAFMPSRDPPEIISGVPNFSTPAFTGLAEIWNTEQLSMNQSSSNFVTIRPQEGDLLRQNLLSSQLPTSDMYFSSEVPASERYPAFPSTSERFHVDPYDSVVNEPFRVPNLNHSYQINESSSEPADNCQGYIDFDNLDFMNCHSEDRIFIGRQNSTGLSFISPGRVDAPAGNRYYHNQNPTSQNILDIPGMCYSSNKGRGAENPKHDPNARSNVCGNVYATKGKVIRHKKVKHGTKESLHCDYCGKRFLKFCMLEIHLRVHTGEKPFICKECNKGFSQNSNLRRHERTHTGEKPYMCKECTKGFTHSSNLTRHEKTHTGERPFLCLECNKRFTCKTNLRKHERTHKAFKS